MVVSTLVTLEVSGRTAMPRQVSMVFGQSAFVL